MADDLNAPVQQPPVPPAVPAVQPATPPVVQQQQPVTPPPVVRTAPPADDADDDDDDSQPRRVMGRSGPAGAGHATEVGEVAIADVRRRERRKALRELYGTTDEAEIEKIKKQRADSEAETKARLERLAAFEQQEEERKRSEMSEVERLTVDLQTAQARIKDLEAELKNQKTSVLQAKQENAVADLARKHHLVPEGRDLLVHALNRHWSGLTQEKKRLFTPSIMEAWVARWVRERPRLVEGDTTQQQIDPETTATTTPANPKPAVRVPLGRNPQQPPPKVAPSRRTATSPTGKSVSQMSPKELDAHYKSMGMKGTPYS